MKITTSQQQVAASSCCDCAVTQCAEPRKRCKSLSYRYQVDVAEIEDGVYYRTGVRAYYWYENYGSGPFHGPENFTTNRRGWQRYEAPCGLDDAQPFDPSSLPPEGSQITSVDPISQSDPMTASDFNALIADADDTVVIPEGAECYGSACDSIREVASEGFANIGPNGYLWQRALYGFGVPENYSTEEIPRSVYEVQWDVVSATVAWWAWYDASMTGTEPTPGPSLVASKEWTWGGSMATEDDQFSEWFEMTLPDAGMETRIANGMVKCYRSTRTGVKPTAWGNQIAIEES